MSADAAAGRNARNLAGFVLIALIWGSTWLVIKDQISVVPAAWSVTWRFTLAAAAMFALAKWRGEPLLLGRAATRHALLFGLAQFSINFQFVYASEHYLTSGLVAVFFALLLVPNALFARLFLGERFSARFILGSLVAIAGIGLLLLHEYREAPAGIDVVTGVLLVSGAVLCASVGNVLQGTRMARSQPMATMLAWGMAIGALGDAAYAYALHGAPVLDPRPEYLMGIAYLALAGTVLTFPIYTALIRDWGAGKAAYNGVAVPVVAMALSTLFEGFRWTGLAIGGAVLAMAGLLIALSGRK
ncbi:EamA family transporter [Novosphingobium sp.]|uniref:DMT family transporter n=1 Tax=Novosphingobium sp. TaxID=1874826 RepID=UPI0025EC6FEA|nr:EamA family transporter [Novosphingobium sp.]MCC6927059.1 EamA family transporter [Novosphingobium sp.]